MAYVSLTTRLSENLIIESSDDIFELDINGKKYRKELFIGKTMRQFKGISDNDFVSLYNYLKKIDDVKISLIKNFKPKLIEDEADYYVVKQGSSHNKISKGDDFSKDRIGYNIFICIHDFIVTKKLFDYNVLQHKQELQMHKKTIQLTLLDAEVLIKDNFKNQIHKKS